MKPQPVPAYVICSVCDLSWPDHGPNPTLMDCIRLLKTRAYPRWHQWGLSPSPIVYSSSATNTIGTTANVTYRTPKEN